MALVVVTGAARSGKSSAAQRLAESRFAEGGGVTVAVFGRASDDEMAARIARHRADRPEGFVTREVGAGDVTTAEATNWLGGVDDSHLLVVDCLGTLLGLIMESAHEDMGGVLGDADADRLPDGYADAVERPFGAVVDALAGRVGDTLVVSNEVGWGVVPEWASARLFRDLMGQANRRLANSADAAYLVIAGRMVPLDRFPVSAAWPED